MFWFIVDAWRWTPQIVPSLDFKPNKKYLEMANVLKIEIDQTAKWQIAAKKDIHIRGSNHFGAKKVSCQPNHFNRMGSKFCQRTTCRRLKQWNGLKSKPNFNKSIVLNSIHLKVNKRESWVLVLGEQTLCLFIAYLTKSAHSEDMWDN